MGLQRVHGVPAAESTASFSQGELLLAVHQPLPSRAGHCHGCSWVARHGMAWHGMAQHGSPPPVLCSPVPCRQRSEVMCMGWANPRALQLIAGGACRAGAGLWQGKEGLHPNSMWLKLGV